MNDKIEDLPFRYSTVAYFDVLAMSDKEYEEFCEEVRKLINSHPFTRHANVQEV